MATFISSFLSGYSIDAVIDSQCSKSIKNAIPQGHFLSPTLFLLLINDRLSRTQCPIHSYANDSTLHFLLFVRRTSQRERYKTLKF